MGVCVVPALFWGCFLELPALFWGCVIPDSYLHDFVVSVGGFVTLARVCSNFFFLGRFLGAWTGPRGGREATWGNLGAAVHHHSLDRLNIAIGDYLKKLKKPDHVTALVY